ncbi:hypothetical protein TNCV_2889411 [Trichonephila clavipes]|nr:hypothetical protein TNCV_2889411 [Trichonephila clavipes]
MAPELIPPFQTTTTPQQEDFEPQQIYRATAPLQGGFSVVLGSGVTENIGAPPANPGFESKVGSYKRYVLDVSQALDPCNVGYAGMYFMPLVLGLELVTCRSRVPDHDQ